MRYKFIAVYQLIGVSRPVEAKEEVLVKYPSIKAKAFLAYDIDSHIFEFERECAFRTVSLNWQLNKIGKDSIEEDTADEMEKLRPKRKESTKDGVFVIFEAKGEVESFNRRNYVELSEFDVAISGAYKRPIREKYQTTINGLLASLTLDLEQMSGIKLEMDGVVFFNDKNKPVYSLNMELSGKLTVSTPLAVDKLDFARKNARALGEQQNLVDIAHLLTKSMDDKSDELLSFLSVWTGLEMFLERNFKTCETSNEDMKNFKDIKRKRNDLIHKGKGEISSLPIKDTQKLLRKYLKLHMTRTKG